MERITPLVVPALLESTVLYRLQHLQSHLDATDISHLARRFAIEHPGKDVFDKALLPDPDMGEIRKFIDKYLADPEAGRTDAWTLRESLVAYSLSALFKDCSIFISLPLVQDGHSWKLADSGPAVKVIDLDLKPLGNMRKWYDLDEQIWRYWHETHQSDITPPAATPDIASAGESYQTPEPLRGIPDRLHNPSTDALFLPTPDRAIDNPIDSPSILPPHLGLLSGPDASSTRALFSRTPGASGTNTPTEDRSIDTRELLVPLNSEPNAQPDREAAEILHGRNDAESAVSRSQQVDQPIEAQEVPPVVLASPIDTTEQEKEEHAPGGVNGQAKKERATEHNEAPAPATSSYSTLQNTEHVSPRTEDHVTPSPVPLAVAHRVNQYISSPTGRMVDDQTTLSEVDPCPGIGPTTADEKRSSMEPSMHHLTSATLIPTSATVEHGIHQSDTSPIISRAATDHDAAIKRLSPADPTVDQGYGSSAAYTGQALSAELTEEASYTTEQHTDPNSHIAPVAMSTPAATGQRQQPVNVPEPLPPSPADPALVSGTEETVDRASDTDGPVRLDADVQQAERITDKHATSATDKVAQETKSSPVKPIPTDSSPKEAEADKHDSLGTPPVLKAALNDKHPSPSSTTLQVGSDDTGDSASTLDVVESNQSRADSVIPSEVQVRPRLSSLR